MKEMNQNRTRIIINFAKFSGFIPVKYRTFQIDKISIFVFFYLKYRRRQQLALIAKLLLANRLFICHEIDWRCKD